MDEFKREITRTLYEKVFPKIKKEKISLFLIGKNAKDKTSFRNQIRYILENQKYVNKKFDVYYPEEIFSELLYNKQMNLLTLENLLAESVHAVIICLESPGAIAELGAFSNHQKLNKKLIVLVNEKHKKAKSFIRQGPLKYLESKKLSQIIWYKDNSSIRSISIKLRFAINKISSKSNIKRNLQNPILVEDYLLMVVYTLGAANSSELVGYIKELESMNPEESATVCIGALNALFKRRAIFLYNNNYVLTRAGYIEFINSLPSIDKKVTIDLIDSLRIKYLNIFLRKSLS